MNITYESVKKNLEELIKGIKKLPSKPSSIDKLERIESLILKLIIKGYSNKEIDKETGLTREIIRDYTGTMYTTLGISDKDTRSRGIEATKMYILHNPESLLDLLKTDDKEKLISKVHCIDTLQEKELYALQYIIKGYSNKEIGEEMHISKDTVRTHIQNMYRKLGISGKAIRSRGIEAMKLYMLRYPKSFLNLLKTGEIKLPKSEPSLIDNLTKDEHNILEYAACGYSNKQIAEEMNISEEAVKQHQPNMYAKLHIYGHFDHSKIIKAINLFRLKYPKAFLNLLIRDKKVIPTLKPELVKNLEGRKIDVLKYIARGYSNKQIAEEMKISENTIRTHTKGIYKNLEIYDKERHIKGVKATLSYILYESYSKR